MCPTNITNQNQIEIKGLATLCFDEAGTWFKGSIEAEDQTQYAIHGMKSNKRRQSTYTQTESGEDLISFNVRLIDCDIGQEYNLKRVRGTCGEAWTFCCDSLKFTSDQVYRGQRADMVTKQFFGEGANGVKTMACLGPIQMNVVPKENLRHWVL